jgi:hypothetical protein
MMRPDSVFVAPGAAAALARKSSPALCSTAAIAAVRVFCNSCTLGMKSCGSAFGSRCKTPSVRPSLTISSSASLSVKPPKERLRASPSV